MILSIFDCSNSIRDAFISQGFEAYSLDLHTGYNGGKVDIVTDILKFEHLAYNRNSVNFLFIALPCQAYSIASGAHHFKNNIPVTSVAIQSINILIKIYQITKHFNCPFIIENPSGGLIKNSFFNSFFKLNVTRLPLGAFGYPTTKKTDLFYNFDMLLLVPFISRQNGRYHKVQLSNLTYRQRVTYPHAFSSYIVENIIKCLSLKPIHHATTSHERV